MVKLLKQDDKNRQEVEPDEAAASQCNLAAYLHARPEVGSRWMLANLALEPPDPFKPNERRKARKGFVVTVFFSTALIAWFVWFNLVR